VRIGHASTLWRARPAGIGRFVYSGAPARPI
jgi:hypothetical protein